MGVGGDQRSAVSPKLKEENVRHRRRSWSTELNADKRQVAQRLKHIQCMGDLHDFNDHRDDGFRSQIREG